MQFIRSAKINIFPPAEGEATEMDMKYIFLMSGVTEAKPTMKKLIMGVLTEEGQGVVKCALRGALFDKVLAQEKKT